MQIEIKAEQQCSAFFITFNQTNKKAYENYSLWRKQQQKFD